MRLLLDSHVWLWACTTPERLPSAVAEAIVTAPEVWLSVVSLWEIAIKHAAGKLPLAMGANGLVEMMTSMGARELPIRADHALHAATLPLRHRDPFDRMLVAQAAVEGMTLVTADELVRGYGGEVLWAGPSQVQT